MLDLFRSFQKLIEMVSKTFIFYIYVYIYNIPLFLYIDHKHLLYSSNFLIHFVWNRPAAQPTPRAVVFKRATMWSPLQWRRHQDNCHLGEGFAVFFAVFGLEIGKTCGFIQVPAMSDLIGIMNLLCMPQKGFNNEHAKLATRMIKSYLQTKPEDICSVCSFFDTLALIYDEINTLWRSRSTPKLTKLVQVRFTSNEMIYIDLNDVREGHPLRYSQIYCTGLYLVLYI